jgi:hypothetical protein
MSMAENHQLAVEIVMACGLIRNSYFLFQVPLVRVWKVSAIIGTRSVQNGCSRKQLVYSTFSCVGACFAVTSPANFESSSEHLYTSELIEHIFKYLAELYLAHASRFCVLTVLGRLRSTQIN